MEGELKTTKHDAIDMAELAMVTNLDVFTCPLKHRFTPGLYAREIFMPAGTLHTSKVHLTEHQYIVSKGACSVYNAESDETVIVVAPYHGITKPGARRVIFVFEDTIWTTFHCIPFVTGNETDSETESMVERIEDLILDKRVNNLLAMEDTQWHLQQ